MTENAANASSRAPEGQRSEPRTDDKRQSFVKGLQANAPNIGRIAADILSSEMAKSAREGMFKMMGGGTPLREGEPICPECGNRICVMSPDVARGLHPLAYCEPWAGIKPGCIWVGPLADCQMYTTTAPATGAGEREEPQV